MRNVKETFKAGLNGIGVNCLEDESKGVLHFGFAGINVIFPCIALIREGSDDGVEPVITLISHYSEIVPKQKHSAVLGKVNEFNSRIAHGSFFMSEGVVYYRTSRRVFEDQVTEDMVESMIFGNMVVIDHTYPLLVGVIHGRHGSREELTPEDLLDLSEDEFAVI